jgi:polyhydroxyalkanoate synthesis regulator phasin
MKTGQNSAAPKRGPGHRAVDARDAIAELTERAQEISQEAGTKVSVAMRDIVSAAAGIAGFAVESARDLVTFMVRRGQMTTEEGDRLLREAEFAHNKRPARERKRPTATEVLTKERTLQRAKAAAQREKEMRKMIAREQAELKKAARKAKRADRAAARRSKPKPKAKAKKKKR